MSGADTPIEVLANQLYTEVIGQFGETTELNPQTLYKFVLIAMSVVEKVRNFPVANEEKGKFKKALVIRLCQIALNKTVLSDSETLQYLVDHVLDNLIDVFVNIDLDGININEDQKNSFKAFLKKICLCGAASQ